MVRWLSWIRAPTGWDYQLSPAWWHAHEMVFGFALPVIAGFLLTAVATWTGLPGTSGRRLQILFGAWLSARVILWLAPGYQWLAGILEMLFIGMLAWELGSRIYAVRQWRNAWFPPILLLLAAVDMASHALAHSPQASSRLFYAMIWLVTTLVVIIGGRVIPLFTGNRLGIRMTAPHPTFEYLVIGITFVAGAAVALQAGEEKARMVSLLCALAGALHLYRMAHWQGWKTARIPLLWSMHLSYLCIPLTLFCLSLAGGDPIAEKNFMHLLAIGSIGGMILSMMSRVSLGHTGRPLVVPPYLAIAFVMVLLAGFVRSLLPSLMPEATGLAWRLSAALWIAAFTLFLWRYLPILTRARADGKPG